MTKKYEPKHKKRECKITVSYDPYDIGQKHCSTHDVRWDGDVPCPKEEK